MYITEEPISFIKELEDVVVMEKDTALFHCTTSKEGIPVKWCFENMEISETEKFKIEIDGKLHRLNIRNCKFDDEGRYKAMLGTKQTSGSLTVKGLITFYTLVDTTVLDHCLIIVSK